MSHEPPRGIHASTELAQPLFDTGNARHQQKRRTLAMRLGAWAPSPAWTEATLEDTTAHR